MIAPVYALYVNLWGTSAKLLGASALTGTPAESSSELFPSTSLSDCQVYFTDTLMRLAASHEIEVYPCGDFAYAFSSDLPRLTNFACLVLQAMVEPHSRNVIWPVRAAIARGAERFPGATQPLLPWIGAGLTKAAELEKSAQKGMRLLIEKWGETPVVDHPIRAIAIRGHEHFEVNWLAQSPAQAKIPDLARRLMDLETNYSQQLSSSLSGLLRWTDEKN